MRTLLAATLVLHAESASHDETSLMQGLARRVEGKLGADNSRYGHDTTKLMETATKMLKSGAAATPDVLNFINSTLASIEDLTRTDPDDPGPIQDEHNRDQQALRDRVAALEAIAAQMLSEQNALEPQIADFEGAVRDHKECRQRESQVCSESRACEVELEIRWHSVKTQETLMREIHGAIHTNICVEPACYEESCVPCMGDRCWNWPNDLAMEGPETSQTSDHWARGPDLYQGHYPVTDYTQELVDWRTVNKQEFTRYIAQKPIVEHAWNRYNAQILECARLEENLEEEVARCDVKQDELDDEICPLVRAQRDSGRNFGRAWRQAVEEYHLTSGQCVDGHGADCDIFDHNYISTGESCSCTGTRSKEWDRKREWETLHIVKCLLTTVYTHVVHAIDTNEPCPTVETHPEQTEAEINYCHVIDSPCPDSQADDGNHCHLTNHLIIDYCHDYSWQEAIKPLPLQCPPRPPVTPRHEPKCSAEYIFETTGHFGQFRDDHMDPGLEVVHAHLSDAGWGGCAAPKACVPCLGDDLVFPAVHYTEPSTPCHEHNLGLALGESDGETFRCRGSWCVPMAARCNGVENCGDGSDEDGCDMPWGHSNLEFSHPSHTDPNREYWIHHSDAESNQNFHTHGGIAAFCREGATVIPGTADDVQFFCNDGSCIPVEGRCNDIDNCADRSDEDGCSAGVTGVSLEPTSGHPASLQTAELNGRVFTDRVTDRDSNRDHARDYTFKSLGDFAGMKFIEMSNEDKSTPHTHVQMKLRLSQPTTVYVLTQHDPLTGTSQTLPWLAADGWTEETTLTGVEYSGLRMTPAKDWSGHLDAIDQEQSHYGTAAVWEKTFPAGVVSMKGNGGGEGYIWTSGVESGHGSYLMFLANPSHRPTPPVPVTSPPEPVDDCRLSAYWEFDSCGCGGNDQNQNWCGGIGSGDCPETIETSICPSGTAYLAEWHPKPYDGSSHAGRGHAGHLVRDGCEYIWHAQYACQAPPAAYTLALADTKCPHRHEDRLFRNPASGSSGITLEECYAQCLATEGCNHFSHGAHNGGTVCMGCTTLVNAQTHVGFTAYDMP